jgi:hypothetical protein
MSRAPDRQFTPAEMTLVKAGQYVWGLYRAEKPGNGGGPSESGPLWEALQTIWNAKKAYRAELNARNRERWAVIRSKVRSAA